MIRTDHADTPVQASANLGEKGRVEPHQRPFLRPAGDPLGVFAMRAGWFDEVEVPEAATPASLRVSP